MVENDYEEKVNYPEDLKPLSFKDKEILAEEIREKILDTVSETGGHLASNLGVVELTIALHSVFNTPLDKAWCIDGEELEPIDDSYEIKIQRNVEILMPTKNVDKLFVKKKKL